MAKKVSGTFLDGERFAKSLGELLDTLPSTSEKQHIISQLEVIIRFLGDVKDRLESIPTKQDASGARAALETLKSIAAETKSNPILGLVLGIKSTIARSAPAPISSEEIEQANLSLAQFEALPAEELRIALDRLDGRGLQAVADALGLKISRRTARVALVHQIATKITNRRGYRSLRDGL
jgi:hypothetical protein